MFVRELSVALAVYNNTAHDSRMHAERGMFPSHDEQKRIERQGYYEKEWLEAGYSIRALRDDGGPTDEVFASGPLPRLP